MKTLKLISLFILGFVLISSCRDDSDKGIIKAPDDVELYIKEVANSTQAWSFHGNGFTHFNGNIWLVNGGFANTVATNYVFRTPDGLNWESVPTTGLTNNKYKPTATVFNNELWLIGGVNSSSIYAEVLKSSDGENWTLVTNTAPFGGTAAHQTFVIGNKMFVLTGLKVSPTSYNQVWSTTDGVNWVEENAEAIPYRYASSLVEFEGDLYIIGGSDGTNYYNDIWRSSDGISWTQVTTVGSIFSPLYLHTTTVMNGKVWIIGGIVSGTQEVVLWHSEDMIHWYEYTDLPSDASPIADHHTLLYGGKLWLFGGLSFNSGSWEESAKIFTIEEI